MIFEQVKQFIDKQWEQAILPTLSDYIRIPNKSPMFDAKWQENGYMDQAAELISQWCKKQDIKGMQLELHRLPGRTPLLFIEIPGQLSDKTVLLYGHFDKQPEMEGWHEDLSPWLPVLKNDRLYGRGAADDGYAVFASLTAIKALQEQNIPHARCVVIIEGSEESGSSDLPFYVDALKNKIGEPSLVICLDSGCGNYEQLWCSTSLRGMVAGVHEVQILDEGVHSGSASGVVPSSFRIMRQLLSRIEDENTGQFKLDFFKSEIPADRIKEAERVANTLGKTVWTEFPFLEKAEPVLANEKELILNRTWRPTLCITGIDGVPSIKSAGNVLRPKTSAMLSIRTSPTCDAKAATLKLKEVLEANPPYNAKVTFTPLKGEHGWSAPPTEPWLARALQEASHELYNKEALYWGEGGSIPFIGMLGHKFPKAQFMVTGVLGPHSNAHGPNEFLHIPYAKKITVSVAYILNAHYKEFSNHS